MYKLNNISTPKKLLETVNKVNTQYSTMPEASALQDRIVQYVGDNTDNYKTGYFYLSTDKGGSWRWELVSGGTGGGGGEEPVSLSGVEIPLDTETGMYIYSLPNDEGMIYIASGYLIDFESETGFAESAGNSAIVVWLSNENKLLNTFSIEFGTHSFSFDESWTSADGTSYINLEGITLIEDTPASITADISYLLVDKIAIEQVEGLNILIERVDQLEQMIADINNTLAGM